MADDFAKLAFGHQQSRADPTFDVIAVAPAFDVSANGFEKSEIIYEPLPEDDPKQRQPDITKARTLLGWEPRVTLEDGIEKTIEYFRGAVPVTV